MIRAFRMVRGRVPVQLVLAGGIASDDPEGERVLGEVREEAGEDPDIHVLRPAPRFAPGNQRPATPRQLVIQKSLREGFGLAVAEAMWKEKPVIGGETGGIVLQVVNDHTGFR